MICTIVSNGKETSFLCKNEYEKPYLTIKRRLREFIWKAYCDGYTDFYVNCEYGIPLWAAEIICAFKYYNDIRLHIVIPYEDQCQNWCEEWRERYFDVHEKADTVIMQNTHPNDACYQQTDVHMIQESSLLLVYGTPENRLYAVQYAQQIGVSVQYIPTIPPYTY